MSWGEAVEIPPELIVGRDAPPFYGTPYQLMQLANGDIILTAGYLHPEHRAPQYFHQTVLRSIDGGRTWINSSTLLGRSNLVRQLITSEKTRFGKEPLQRYLSGLDLRRPRSIIDHLEPLLFAVSIPEAAKERIELLMNPGTSESLTEGLHALCTLPEFQLC